MTLREELAVAGLGEETVEMRVSCGHLRLVPRNDDARLEALRREWRAARARVEELENQMRRLS
jgi:hypothetical protein